MLKERFCCQVLCGKVGPQGHDEGVDSQEIEAGLRGDAQGCWIMLQSTGRERRGRAARQPAKGQLTSREW